MAAPDIVLIVDRLLHFRTASDVVTKQFSEIKHNRHLCPAAERQLKRVVDAFERYQKIVYDVQGIHDRGTDVVVRMPFISDEAVYTVHKFVCLQLKSFDDFEGPNYLQIIKAQWAETQADRNDDLEHYYLLLCTDAIKHKDKIRAVNGFFAGIPKATVISPGESWTFLRLGESWINAVIESVYLEGDTVRRKARDFVVDLTPQETAILVLVMCKEIESGNRVTVDELKKSSLVSQVYQRVPDYPRDYFVGFDEFGDEDDDSDDELGDDELGDDELDSNTIVDQHRPIGYRPTNSVNASSVLLRSE